MNATVNLCDTRLAKVIDMDEIINQFDGDGELAWTANPIDEFVHFMSMEDLPEIGKAKTVYKCTNTCDLFVFVKDRYMAFNPYAPIDKQITEIRQCIVDDTANMPTGGKGSLAVVYNVHALRRDLYMKEKLGWSFFDMLPPGILLKTDDLATQRNKYFRYSHKALMDQIRYMGRQQQRLVTDIIDSLQRIGVDVWFNVEKHEFGFKDGEFVAVFA